MKEKIAAITVIITLLAAPLFVFGYRAWKERQSSPPDVRIFNITAFAGNGVYTLEEVNGFNYWWKRFEPMALTLKIGDKVKLTVRSADVRHSFYIPGLNIGPIEVKPEKPSIIEFVASESGIFQYFCMTMCGQCHVFMTGWIVISSDQEKLAMPNPIVCPLCFVNYERPEIKNIVELGGYLYLNWACNACHGWDGMGGVKNLNYAKETVPRHDDTATKLFLKTLEDASAFTELLKKYPNLEDIEDEVEIPLYPLVKNRYQALKNIIRNGSKPQKKDPKGAEPPLWMPAWKYKLTEQEMDALILYLLDLYPWEEMAEENEGEN